MRTKHLITAMVLPALFAACTAEELVENNATALQDRALLDPNFSISVEGNGVDSRFSWNETAFGWNAFTANDKFSAGLIDDASGNVQDNVLTNYVFGTEDAVNYTTTSQMVEGTYFFYSYPGFETSAAREKVPFNLTSQVKVDLNNPAATVEANQLFVSPVYVLEAENANEKLPLYFISYWSTAAVKVKNTSGSPMKIRRITLTDSNAKFAVKGLLSPSTLANNNNKLYYTWNEEANAYVLPANIVKENMKLANFATSVTKQDVVTVDCQAYEVANGEEALAYIQVPAGRHYNVGVTVVVEVETSLGTALKDINFTMVNNSTDGNGAACVDFKRGHTIPVYGIENGGVKAFAINKIVLASAEPQKGEYADSYEALESIVLNNNPLTSGYAGTEASPIVVNNLGALQLNDDVMYLLNQTGKVVKFQNAIEVTSLGAGVVKNAQFGSDVNVISGNVTFSNGVTLLAGAGSGDAENVFTIEEGAAATIASGTWNKVNTKIYNKGTLTLGVISEITKIQNDAKKASMIVAVNGVFAGSYTDSNSDLHKGIQNLTSPKNLTINKYASFTTYMPFEVGQAQKITNNGTLSGCGVFVNKGTFTNNGIVNNIKNENGSTDADGNPVVAVINNYGKIYNVNNVKHSTKGSALISQEDVAAEVNTATGSGNIDNTIDAIVTSARTNSVYAEYTGNQTGKLGNVMACTKVILTDGIWTNPSVAANVSTLSMSGVTLNSNAAISFATVDDLTMINSIANKAVTFGRVADTDNNITAVNMVSATLDGSTFNGAATFIGLTDLDLYNVTFNGAVTATSASLEVLNDSEWPYTTSSTVNGAMTIGGTLTVKSNATLTVTTSASISGVTTITNNGKIVNKGSIDASSAGAKFGDWSGNATI